MAYLKVGVAKTGIRRNFPTLIKVLVPILFDPFLAQPVTAFALNQCCLGPPSKSFFNTIGHQRTSCAA